MRCRGSLSRGGPANFSPLTTNDSAASDRHTPAITDTEGIRQGVLLALMDFLRHLGGAANGQDL
jgi:hypothetical protein